MTYSDFAKQYLGVKQGSTKHKKILAVYNSIKPLPRGYKVKVSDNWCATFVSFVLYSCGCKRNVFECGAQRMLTKCKKYLLEDTAKGKPDDIIFYDWQHDGWCDHVGIIQFVQGNYYIVIEGNKNKRVETRKISRKSKSIKAIARV